MQARVRGWLAPSICVAAVALLLVSVRFYEGWFIKPPPCSLKTLTGIPCAGCGGTRAMQALSHGEFFSALRFNPLAVAAVIAVAAWFVASFFGSFREKEDGMNTGRGKHWGFVIGAAFLLNWIYLVCFPPG